jgi:DNA repair protein RadC
MQRRINGPQSTAGFFQPLLSDCINEHGIAVFFDSNGHVSGISHNLGDETSIALSMRKMVQTALACSANQVILVHNHPSGRAQPSEADCYFTRQFGRVLNAIDIELLDHIIVAKDEWVSFRMLGLL